MLIQRKCIRIHFVRLDVHLCGNKTSAYKYYLLYNYGSACVSLTNRYDVNAFDDTQYQIVWKI